MTIYTHVPRALALALGAAGTGWLLTSAGATHATAPPSLESIVTAAIALMGAIACLAVAAITLLGTIESLVLRRPSRVHRALPAGLRRLVTGTVAASVLAGSALPASADEVYPGWAPPSPSPTLASPEPSPSPSPVVEVSASAPPAAAAPVQKPAVPAALAAPTAPKAEPVTPPVVELHAESSAPALPHNPPPAQEGVHIVSRGESLWRITADLLGPHATTEEIASTWPLIYEANREVIGDNPSLIHPGQRLAIPQEVAA